MTKGDKSVTMNTECVNIHEGKKMHLIECPKDFLDYFNAFIDYKDNNILDMKYAVYNKRNSEKKIDLNDIETTNQIKLSDYPKDELKKIIKLQLAAYNQHYLSDLPSIPASELIENIDLKNPVRPVFFELFELIMWYFMQYFYEIDLQPPEQERTVHDVEYDYENLKQNLAILVQNTLYTNKNIEAPVNIDLSKYNLPAPRKISKKYSVYGEMFIEAANLYRRLRMYWLAIVREYPPVAELLETLLADTVKFGYRYCNLRYVKSFSRGGITKDKKTDAVRIKIHNIYDKLKDQRISMSALAGQILSSKENMRTIEFLERKYFIPQLNTIKKWVKEWDYENNIDRSKYPRARKMRHF